MVELETFVVIPVKDRHELTRNLIAQLGLDSEHIIVIDNASTEPAWQALAGLCRIIEQEETNFSSLCNRGIVAATVLSKTEKFNVAVLNNDLEVPPNFLADMEQALRSKDVGLVYPDQYDRLVPGELRVYKSPNDRVSLHERMCGYAFMMRGELCLRYDESMVWWYSDDDLEWRCMELYGTAMVGGVKVNHLHPNELTNANPHLVAQTALDRETFLAKWGRLPH